MVCSAEGPVSKKQRASVPKSWAQCIILRQGSHGRWWGSPGFDRPSARFRQSFPMLLRDATRQESQHKLDIIASVRPRHSTVMEPSPLTQDSRPDIFQPKIISLYETLFKVGGFPLPFGAENWLTRYRKTRTMSTYPTASGMSFFFTGQILPG